MERPMASRRRGLLALLAPPPAARPRSRPPAHSPGPAPRVAAWRAACREPVQAQMASYRPLRAYWRAVAAQAPSRHLRQPAASRRVLQAARRRRRRRWRRRRRRRRLRLRSPCLCKATACEAVSRIRNSVPRMATSSAPRAISSRTCPPWAICNAESCRRSLQLSISAASPRASASSSK